MVDRKAAAAADHSLNLVFAALSDPVRRRLLSRLDGEALLVSELAAPFDISLQAVSKHIQVLVKAGLVRQERTGRVSRCRLDAGPMHEAALWVNRYSKYWQDQFDTLALFLGDIDKPKARRKPRRKSGPIATRRKSSRRYAPKSAGCATKCARRRTASSRNRSRIIRSPRQTDRSSSGTCSATRTRCSSSTTWARRAAFARCGPTGSTACCRISKAAPRSWCRRLTIPTNNGNSRTAAAGRSAWCRTRAAVSPPTWVTRTERNSSPACRSSKNRTE